MSATELLTTLCDRGLSVQANGDLLIVKPRDLLTDELRAEIRANKAAILEKLKAAANNSALTTPLDLGTERRRAKALALLEANPNWRRLVIAEVGDPVVLGIAIQMLGYGELEIPPKKYDPFVLMALLDQHGGTTQ